MKCQDLIYFIFNIYINIKLFIISKCFKKELDFNVSAITIYDNNNNLIKISDHKQINNILLNKWYAIKQYNANTLMIDIEYFYNNNMYNMIYKFPNPFIFPIEFKQSKIKLLYTDDNINDLIMKYAGPMKDFYDNNSQKITMNDIFIFNNITNMKDVLIVNSDLSEKRIAINEIIDLKI